MSSPMPAAKSPASGDPPDMKVERVSAASRKIN
jgi:hypothetical protein